MIRAIIIILLFTVASCKKEISKPESCNTLFEIAPDLDHWAKDSLGNFIEVPRFHYYEEHNFIINKSGSIFYYPRQKRPLFHGNDVIKTQRKPIPIPDFINLQPYQIIELKENQISDFVKLNINIKDQYNFIVIASERNKFKSDGICSLFDSLHDKNSQSLLLIRKITEEEKIVMKYKMKNEYYNPAEIKWTETNIVKADFK